MDPDLSEGSVKSQGTDTSSVSDDSNHETKELLSKSKRRSYMKRKLCLLYSFTWWSDIVRRGFKTPKHDSKLPGYMWMMELWRGNEHRFFEQFRMRKEVMDLLVKLLQEKYNFVPFNRIGADESVAMFLLLVGHAATFPYVTERFQHSVQTVSAHFHEVLDAVCRFGKSIIQPDDPSFSTVPSKLRDDKRYYPHFSGCVGAIDGTHIAVRVGEGHITPWINRKGVTSTNVLAAVVFNLCITFAKIGLEGSMHDSRILYMALRTKDRPFPIPPEGKYYLADSRYPNIKGFLVPYKKTRYHLTDFRQAGVIRSDEENFNYLHSSLRSIVERTFGILKEKFKILRNMPRFDLKTQLKIIYACMAIHNFLRKHEEDDVNLLGRIRDELHDEDADAASQRWSEPTREDGTFMDNIRNTIKLSARRTRNIPR